jgi:adenylate cyclase
MPYQPNGPYRSGFYCNSPPEDDIRQQLEKILASLEFQNSPMLCDFLRFVVAKTLSGCAQEIKGYTVATEVFGRKADFDAAKDTIVRIQGGRLRRALERYYLTIGRQDPIRIDIPKGAYVPTFHLAAREEAGVKVSPTALDNGVLAIPPGPSVAVLPLLNLTGDRKQTFFADGLAEEITNELARYQDLRVIAFQSTLRWKGAKLDAREVGRDLNIRFFLEGSIRKEARLIKITIRLVDTLNGIQVWGDHYQRQLRPDKLIALQEEIAQKVAAKIGSEYGIIPRNLSQESRKKPPESLDTYEAFLRFYHHVNILTPETFEETLHVMEQAVTREPECGLAWSQLAQLYGQNHTLQFSPLETPLEKALIFAKKGVSLDSQNQLVRATMAYLYFRYNERDLFRLEVEKAMALNPNSPLLIGYLGWLLALYGEWDRGLAILGKGMALNPHYPGWFRMAPYFYFYRQGKYMDALHEAQQFQMPQFFWDLLLRAAALGQLGREREAAQAVAELLRLKPDFSTNGPFLIGCYVKVKDLADALLDGLRLAGLKI